MAESILHPEYHAPLIKNLDLVVEQSRVPRHLILQSSAQYLSEVEIDWLSRINEHVLNGVAGVCFHSNGKAIELKMAAMAAVLIRNFIDARLVPVTSLLAKDSKGETPNPTVLFVPNFCVLYEGKTLPAWQLQELHSLLVDRFTTGRLSVLYVQSLDTLGKQYGDGIRDYIENYFMMVGA